MALIGDLHGLGADGLREANGEFQLVRGLNEVRFDAICALLQGQSPADLKAFEKAVKRLVGKGYQLTSLVADLRSPAREGVVRTWRCEVRPKIGSIPRRVDSVKTGSRRDRT